MKYEKRYNWWTQFLEDYKEYFVNSLLIKECDVEEEIIVIPKKNKTTKLTKPK